MRLGIAQVTATAAPLRGVNGCHQWNAMAMLESDGVSPHTAHTSNPVPLLLTAEKLTLREAGELSDLAPTCLHLLGISAPPEMTGRTLVQDTGGHLS